MRSTYILIKGAVQEKAIASNVSLAVTTADLQAFVAKYSDQIFTEELGKLQKVK